MTARKATKKTAKSGKSRKQKARKTASAAKPKKKAASKKVARKPAAKPSKKAAKPAKKAAKQAPKGPAAKAPEKAGQKASGRKAPAVSSARSKARSKARARRSRASSARGPVIPGQPPPGPRQTRLGQKWACFSCGAKFYDLNQPEPLCPKCGADQRAKPPTKAPSPPPAPKAKKEARPLAPYLDDDDDATRRDASVTGDELDVGIAGIAADEDVDPAIDIEDDTEEVVEEDD